MDLSEMQNILRKMEFDRPIRSAVQFCSEEDGSPYDVWKIETDAKLSASEVQAQSRPGAACGNRGAAGRLRLSDLWC